MRLLFSGKRNWLAVVAVMAVAALTLAACTKEVVREVEVPGETVVIEKEVIREVEVAGETVVVEKVVPTPDRYPRRPGMPAKRPL